MMLLKFIAKGAVEGVDENRRSSEKIVAVTLTDLTPTDHNHRRRPAAGPARRSAINSIDGGVVKHRI